MSRDKLRATKGNAELARHLSRRPVDYAARRYCISKVDPCAAEAARPVHAEITTFNGGVYNVIGNVLRVSRPRRTFYLRVPVGELASATLRTHGRRAYERSYAQVYKRTIHDEALTHASLNRAGNARQERWRRARGNRRAEETRGIQPGIDPAGAAAFQMENKVESIDSFR